MLGPESARIFRITHIDNVPWILDHGLHCKTSLVQDLNFVSIGMKDLIEKRTSRQVPIGPGGTLADYVPFYFTPFSIMMYNIKTGYNDVTQRRNGEIAILVSSIYKLEEGGTRYVYTNGHAFLQETEYYDDLDNLNQIDWELLRQRNFNKDPEDPGKGARYQAEALVHLRVPVGALLGIACHDVIANKRIESELQSRDLSIPVRTMPQWYF